MTWEEYLIFHGREAAKILGQEVKIGSLNLNQQAGTGSLNPYQNQLSQMQELQRQQMLNQLNQQNMAGQFLGHSIPTPFMSQMAQNPTPQTAEFKDALETGTKVEDLIGYRIWIIANSGMLKSYSVGSIWLPDQPMTGEPGDHDNAGVWAFKDRDSAIAKLNGHNAAAGSVRLWGQVVEHEKGYRAEFARIVSIDTISLPRKYPWDRSHMRALKWLRQTYGVEA